MQYLLIVWPLFCAALAWMQGRLMPAIRRTPPGEEADEQDSALHKVGTLAYFLPIAFAAPALWLVSALIALASRAALFDFVLNKAARRPAFEVGQTAFTDKWLRKMSPAHPERLSAAARLLTAVLLAGAAAVVASRGQQQPTYNSQPMHSYPTPEGAAHIERMNEGFLKLHPGPPVHVFKQCHDAEFHTHPFPFTTHIVEVGYREELLVPQPDGTHAVVTLDRLPGTSHDMPLGLPHRLVGLLGEGVGITRCEYGPTMQKPGFVRLLPDGRAEHRFWDEPDNWQPWPLAA